ncbi:N-acetylmuramoyl-L-alanine amidase CwlD [Geomicrobium sediminis]|uniref:N-acetylmuramoyl-L-alanine amidase n=1 Tax=Geomicrobium sediminis TaxID=1347788 RepID=A0ABS2PGR1_9BACL|nr:N-acetylmuramoyl-L-alanine amidase CwlD [Geomicrobium sediminis]MBM7634625.1 N-acetylmuramoyl-L-alanine amidase [Geomicrobium sediminis]
MKKRMKFAWVLVILFAGLMAYSMYALFSNEDTSTLEMPLSGNVIILDAGHGGVDGGSVAKSGTLEKDVALDISLKLRDYLQASGALVYMTREGDSDLANESTRGFSNRKTEDLKKRIEIINSSNADYYVSLHLNATPSSKWRGAQTFYNRTFEESKLMAESVQGEMVRQLENTNRSALPIHNIFLVDRAEIPGVLVEVGFLSNVQEAADLGTEEYQDKVAASIYQGMLRYKVPELAEENEAGN